MTRWRSLLVHLPAYGLHLLTAAVWLSPAVRHAGEATAADRHDTLAASVVGLLVQLGTFWLNHRQPPGPPPPCTCGGGDPFASARA